MDFETSSCMLYCVACYGGEATGGVPALPCGAAARLIPPHLHDDQRLAAAAAAGGHRLGGGPHLRPLGGDCQPAGLRPGGGGGPHGQALGEAQPLAHPLYRHRHHHGLHKKLNYGRKTKLN